MQRRAQTLYSIYVLVGAMMPALLGDGVCCNVSLDGHGQKGGSTVHIAIGYFKVIALED